MNEGAQQEGGPTVRRAPWRRLVKRLIFAVVPLLVLVLGLEAAQRVRLFVRTHERKWLLYGITEVAERRKPVAIINVEALTNERIRARVGSPGPTKYIVCVGSSTTEGIYNDERHTYPYFLGEMIREARSRRDAEYRVVNLGSSSATSEDYGHILARLPAQVIPDVVIFYVGYTDTFMRGYNGTYAQFQASLGPVWYWAEGKSLLLMTATEKYMIWRNQRQASASNVERLAGYLRDFRQNIGEQVADLRTRGIRVVLIPEVLMPAPASAGDRTPAPEAERYAPVPKALEDIARSHGAEFLNIQDYFSGRDPAPYFADIVHLTDAGNRELSQAILERSSTLRGLLRSASSPRGGQ